MSGRQANRELFTEAGRHPFLPASKAAAPTPTNRTPSTTRASTGVPGGVRPLEFLMFSKMLQELPIADTADVMARLGFDGVDLTVRDKGHVLPENVVAELPSACEVFREKGLEVGMLTTAITSVEDEHAQAVFGTASACGVNLLKLG